jgi:hypothetical protein
MIDQRSSCPTIDALIFFWEIDFSMHISALYIAAQPVRNEHRTEEYGMSVDQFTEQELAHIARIVSDLERLVRDGQIVALLQKSTVQAGVHPRS